MRRRFPWLVVLLMAAAAAHLTWVLAHQPSFLVRFSGDAGTPFVATIQTWAKGSPNARRLRFRGTVPVEKRARGVTCHVDVTVKGPGAVQVDITHGDQASGQARAEGTGSTLAIHTTVAGGGIPDVVLFEGAFLFAAAVTLCGLYLRRRRRETRHDQPLPG